ncbi:hypothetical protein D7X48_18255 [bacterium D16-50]|nr:hypothetical protein D7X48_18255 [bacterium D16-50]
MIETKIDVDVEDVKRRLGELGSKAPSVISRAINRTLTNIKKNVAQQTGGNRGVYNIRSETVKNTLDTKKATIKSLKGSVTSSGSPMLLSSFDAKLKPGPMEPVSYQRGRPSPLFYKAAVKKMGGRKAVGGEPKAFVAHSEKAKGMIFMQRLSRKGYPLQPLYGPSVPQMIENRDVLDFIENEARSTLQKRIDAEIRNILRKEGTT